MASQINPFDSGFSAKFVVNDKARALRDIVNGFKSIVCIATLEASGQLTMEFVSREHRRVSEALHDENGLMCLSLPLLVLRADDDATANATPKMVS